MNGRPKLRSAVVLGPFACTAALQTVSAASASADDTTVNSSERDAHASTPMDQSNGQSAIRISADNRRAVLSDRALTTPAHNVEITTRGNTITLRGPVATTAEKERIDALARQFAAGKHIRDQLTVGHHLERGGDSSEIASGLRRNSESALDQL